MSGFRLALALLLPLLLPGAGGGTVFAAEPQTATLEQGRKIYNFRCYYCHGYSGNAKTLASRFLSPPPRDFTSAPPLPRERMVTSVTHGRENTAMMGFSTVLKPEDIEAVVDFVISEFVVNKRENTRYHIPENGWANHERYAIAFPFATGALALDTPDESLTQEQRNGKALYLSTCISCHDRGHLLEEGPIWESRPVSYPRGAYSHTLEPNTSEPSDAISGATPYAIHDLAPTIANLSPKAKKGEALFQKNCAFCHAADGTARNWIGLFLEPHPRDLTNPVFMSSITQDQLAQRIRDGLPGTSMPAWKHVLDSDEIDAIIHYIAQAFHPLSDLNLTR